MRTTFRGIGFFIVTCSIATQASAQSVQASPHRVVGPIRLSEVKWMDGFWKQRLRTCRNKTADFLDEANRNPTPEQAGHAICPSHYMGLLDLYRATSETRYLNLVERLIQMRDRIVDGGDDNQDRLPSTRQSEAVGHAVRVTYLYAGIADLYAETGDEELWTPLTAIWGNLVDKKLYITGGCGALYAGASPDGSKDQGAITRVPADVELQAGFDADLLDGVSVLEGELVSVNTGDWQNKLYREFKRPQTTTIRATLIPYYTWSNRGTSEISVWLPLN